MSGYFERADEAVQAVLECIEEDKNFSLEDFLASLGFYLDLSRGQDDG